MDLHDDQLKRRHPGTRREGAALALHVPGSWDPKKLAAPPQGNWSKATVPPCPVTLSMILIILKMKAQPQK